MYNLFNKKFIIKLLVSSLLLTSLSIAGCKKNEDEMVSSKIKIDSIKKDQMERPELRGKFEDAKKQNSDTVAWLFIPNTTIDFPIVQDLQNRGKGYEDYYVHRDFKGNKVAIGRESAIMSDKNNVTTPFSELSRNLIISGHNVDLQDRPDGKMFAPLGHFKNLEFSKKTPYIFLSTKDKDLVYEVFASYYSEERFGSNLPKKSEKEMSDMVKEAKERSLFNYDDVKLDGKDKVLTLYTCTYHFGTYNSLGYQRTKYIVQAKLLPEKEKLQAAANVTVNPKPKAVNYTYCASCGRDMTVAKCSANLGLCDKCKGK